MAASADDMRHQMQIMLDQVRNLGAAVQANQERLADYDSVRATLNDLEIRVGNFADSAGPRAMAGSVALINPKELKVKEFDGSDKDFRDFLEASRAYFEIVKPQLSELIEWIEFQPGVVDMVTVRQRYANHDAMARMFHGWFRRKLRAWRGNGARTRTQATGSKLGATYWPGTTLRLGHPCSTSKRGSARSSAERP